jgi:hypothetical protein
MITGVVVVVVVIAILMVFRGPRTWLISPLGRERIGIVQVHATIVSILFAAMWVSATNLLNMLWQLEERAFQEARESETPRFQVEGGRVHIDPGGGPIETSTAANRKKAVNWLDSIVRVCGRFLVTH